MRARTGFTSLAVAAGAIGVVAGFPLADPIVGLVITMAIVVVLKGAATEVFRRLLDRLHAETSLHVGGDLDMRAGHDIAHDAEVRLRREVPNLSVATVHVSPPTLETMRSSPR